MSTDAEGYPPLNVKVWGDLACFTRPEFKVERVTYPVMTPSAARGVLEAIFWKPQFTWLVREIRVLRDIRYLSFLRNEVNSVASHEAAANWASDGGGYIASHDRAQRNTLALRDVAYVITADVRVKPGVAEPAAKFRDQFRRRVKTGRCFQMPYLGCREFVAFFEEPERTDSPIDRSEDLGPMLLDISYSTDGSGPAEPVFFDARMDHGVIRIPEPEVA